MAAVVVAAVVEAAVVVAAVAAAVKYSTPQKYWARSIPVYIYIYNIYIYE